MRAVVPLVLLFLGFTNAGYAPVGFVQPPFIPFPQTTVTKLDPIHVQTTVRFPNGFTRVFYPNKGPGFPFFGGHPPIMPAPVFPVATDLIRPAPIQTVIPVEPKVKPEPVPVKPIIEKPETLKPVEKVGKPVYGGTFVVNIDRTKDFRPEPSVQHIHSFERIRLPLPPSPPQPQIPPPQIWRTEVPRPVVQRQNNFFRDNFQFDSRTFERRFNIVPRVDRQEPVQDFRPPMPQPIRPVPQIDRQEPVKDFRPPMPQPIFPEILPRTTGLDQTPIRINRIEIVLQRVPPQPVDNVEPVIQIQTSHPVVPVMPPEPVSPPILPPEPIAEINQGPIIPPEGPTRGDVPNIGIISPIPGDQGNVLMDFKEANAASNKLDMIRNEFTEIGGGVNAMRINTDKKAGQLVGGPGPAVDIGPGPGPDPLVDLGMNSGFVSGANMQADNSLFSNDFSMSHSNFAAGDHLIGGGNGFDHVDSININIDPSLGLDFGPQNGPLLGPPDMDPQFNSKDLMAQAEIENNLAFNNQKGSNFEATSNFVKPAPISMAEASFDNSAFSSKSSKDFSASAGHKDENRVIRRTTTVRKIRRTLI
ncbi:serine/threonine-protein kinase WNK2 isoform X2 [Magallana gigas]|uniref:serine/threonine-protein kinase WNK2 isoform X2 n=1 Tax=Magallana gigas TaxID=29159 RepID=UPI003341055A